MTGWTATDVGDQHGRTVVITGANGGIGLETAKVFAARGASVVLACRDRGKAMATAAALPGGNVTTVGLDLGSLASIRHAAEELRSRHSRLDLLINNAGLMMPPLGHTEDGFELQIGINHLGHFALTGLLLDRLLTTPGSRIVTVSSSAHRQGRIDIDDLHFQRRRYKPTTAYSQSKLANLLFTYELQRRLTAAAANPIAVALEPGIISTGLQRHVSGAMAFSVAVLGKLIGQPDTAAGALATLRTATDPAVKGADYYAPDGRILNASGHPVPVRSSSASHDADTQRRLWVESERLTGVTYSFNSRSDAGTAA
ncbi:oxidoreductase [Frankia sp. Cas3]|uniref:oxidoreductase n=1 Tax=Frankia sp. Cas3 TaxID=3073926 RepID=UPI002AD23FB2|nr:oxidoreductase [Frankia sp. Cas3]